MGLMRQVLDDRLAVLDADAWFDDIPVLTHRNGDLDSLIAQATAKLGTCVVLWCPSFDVENQQIPELFGELHITASIFEQVQINQAEGGTRKFAEDTAECVAALWMLHKKLAGSSNSVYPLTPTIAPEADPDFVRYDVRYAVKVGEKYIEAPSLNTDNNDQLLTDAGITILAGETATQL